MATNVQSTIDFSQPFIQYSPMAVGVGNQPALGIANEIQYMVGSAPFTWGWNRKEDASLTTVAGTQDYSVNLTDFSFLEDVTLTKVSDGSVFKVQEIYNTAVLSIADASPNKRGRPNAACILSVTYGTSIKLRFMGVPDVPYLVTLTYQKLIAPLTALTGASGTWTIPDQYQDIYNNLFLGEAMATVEDARANIYRQRGVTALLAKAEGLTEMQKNLFLEQFWARNNQQQAGTLRTQQAQQARGV